MDQFIATVWLASIVVIAVAALHIALRALLVALALVAELRAAATWQTTAGAETPEAVGVVVPFPVHTLRSAPGFAREKRARGVVDSPARAVA